MNTSAYALGQNVALRTFKLGEFNFKLTVTPKDRDAIPGDNGCSSYGVKFDEPDRPNRRVGQAFDSMRVQKPSDFLNEGNEGMIGATA